MCAFRLTGKVSVCFEFYVQLQMKHSAFIILYIYMYTCLFCVCVNTLAQNVQMLLESTSLLTQCLAFLPIIVILNTCPFVCLFVLCFFWGVGWGGVFSSLIPNDKMAVEVTLDFYMIQIILSQSINMATDG